MIAWIVLAVAFILLLAATVVWVAGFRQRQQLTTIRREQFQANSAIDRLTMQALRSMLEEARRSSAPGRWGD